MHSLHRLEVQRACACSRLQRKPSPGRSVIARANGPAGNPNLVKVRYPSDQSSIVIVETLLSIRLWACAARVC